MIYDCFTFFNENDVLAIRLEELYPVVDRFIIVQSAKTFRNDDKPNYYDAERFQRYADKISIFELGLLEGRNNWEREIFQRNAIKDFVALYAEPEDTVIISDVDEIPRRSTVRHVVEETRLHLDKYSYSINMLTDEGNSSVRMIPFKDITTCEKIRRDDCPNLVFNAGWEFSSLGTPEQVMKKFKAFSHDEFDSVISEDIFAKRMARGVDLLGRDIVHVYEEVNETFPEAIKNDREFWSKYEWKSD